MSLYAISDLHLALSIDKPMDIFGARWANYMDKLKLAWENSITENDYIIIPGDISWATYLEHAVEDFSFIESLPGNKIISKGNHDYWWNTLNKLKSFINENNFRTISFMQNNSFDLGDYVLCGTRGWKCPGDDEFSVEDKKIYSREIQRLELSLKDIKVHKPIIVALHFPPFNSKFEVSGFIELLLKYNVSTCVYGHLHGESNRNAFEGTIGNTVFKNISADRLSFIPHRID